MTENYQQNHLKELIKQQETLRTELMDAQNAMSLKRDMLLKVQGAIEYLTQVGVTLEQVEEENLQDEEVEV